MSTPHFRRNRAPDARRRKPLLPTFEQLEDRLVPNSMPTITDPGVQHAAEGNTLTLQIVASADPGGDALSYSFNGGMFSVPPNLTINGSTGLISGAIDFGDINSDLMRGGTSSYMPLLQVAQGTYTASQYLTWVITDSPVLQLATWSVSEGQTVSVDARTSAGQSASGLTYSFSGGFGGGLPGGLTMNSSGQITGTVHYGDVSFGSSESFVGTVSAASGTFLETAPITFVVTQATLVQAHSWAITEGQAASLDPRTSSGQSATGLTYSLSVSPGLPSGLTFNSSTGQITGTPDYTIVAPGATSTFAGAVTAATGTYSQIASLTWSVSGVTPSVQFSAASYTASESVGAATIGVTLPAQASSTITVHYSTSNGSAISGTDYTSTSGNLTFTPGRHQRVFHGPPPG